VNGDYTLDDYVQALIDAGAYAQSNGTSVRSPGISYEVANSTAAIPSAKGSPPPPPFVSTMTCLPCPYPFPPPGLPPPFSPSLTIHQGEGGWAVPTLASTY